MQQLLTEHMAIWTAADTEKKSGRGRASGNAGSVYGIKKLRELILELAVRGKLVPQDANDEPASELLKHIQTEKATLVAEGKIKNDKPLVPVGEDEKPFELPHGWEWVHLPDVTEYKVGKTPSTKSSVYWTTDNTGYNWVSIADLNHDDVVTETAKKVTHQALKEVFKTDPVPVGTILMSFKLTLGKISILQVPAFHNEAIISIYPSSAIDKHYLFKMLPARANEGNSKSAIKGNTLNSESIAALLLPLPPLAEQQRIVSKVDELMALCDQLEAQHSNAAEAHEKLVSHLLGTLTQPESADDFSANWQRIAAHFDTLAAHFDTLFTTEASIDALKQTLLQLAVMGKLVPQDANDEPAIELLKRIQAEKAKLVAEGKIKKEKPLTAIGDDEKPFELPNAWEFARLSNVATLENGDRGKNYPNKDALVQEGVPFVNAGHLENGVVNKLEMTFITEQRYGVLSGGKFIEEDILFCLRGSLGKCAVVKDIPKGAIASSLVIIRVNPNITLNYFYNYLISNLLMQSVKKYDNGTAQPNLSSTDLAKFVVPIPPVDEQHRIVAKVDALMALCDQLEAQHSNAAEAHEKLVSHLLGTLTQPESADDFSANWQRIAAHFDTL
ncbi:MAG: restriction endonuclease subunit S, partial [Methylophilales bacterium]|nr:restriction endonuclease subunit S [Methylophilales bacterium]